MAQFRAKKLDLGCFINIKVIRDHTKRKVFEQNEVERCVFMPTFPSYFVARLRSRGAERGRSTRRTRKRRRREGVCADACLLADKPCDTSSATRLYRSERERRRSCSCHRCTATPDRRR